MPKSKEKIEAQDEGVVCSLEGTRGGLKAINLALQGGGAHGAFAWGVLDKILEDGRIDIEGISGASAGSMNAVVLAHGISKGGREGAREALHNFWEAISETGQRYNPIRRMPWETMLYGSKSDNSWAYTWFKLMVASFSPYQFNPFDFNPLRDVLESQVNFERLNQCQSVKLFLSATNIRTGKVKVFRTENITAEVVLASACLPSLFKAVQIDDQYYWDGGYMGNPVLFPFFNHTKARDIMIVHINPLERDSLPRLVDEIDDRLNEITFNASLLKEFRAIAFVHKLIDQGWLKDEYRDKLKYILVHSIRADMALGEFSLASKFDCSWDFLMLLRDRGREAAGEWLHRHFDDIGQRSTVDIRREFS